MNELRLVVPMIPPSAGHYMLYRVVVPRGAKPFVQAYPSEHAKAWWEMVAAVNAGRKLRGQSLEIQYIVYCPDRRKRDVDNFAKCIFDGLTKAGAIEDDKLVDDFHGHRRYDPGNPRTVILVKSRGALMKERPILFRGPMVRAILEGRKTQTRRVVKWKPREGSLNLDAASLTVGHYFTGAPSSGYVLRSRGAGSCWNDRTWPLHCPYGVTGDRLWVRETFRLRADQDSKPPSQDWWKSGAWYQADGNCEPSGCGGGAGTSPWYLHAALGLAHHVGDHGRSGAAVAGDQRGRRKGRGRHSVRPSMATAGRIGVDNIHRAG